MENEIAYVAASSSSTFPARRTVTSPIYSQQTSCVRKQIAILLASCVFCMDLLRLNFSIALPFMLNVTDSSTQWELADNRSQSCAGASADSKPRVGPHDSQNDVVIEKLEWTPLQQSLLVSSFYLGAAVSGFPAYSIAKKKAPRQLLMTAVALTSLLSIFLPTAAFFGFAPAFGVRFCQGAAKAFVIPALLRIVISWIPSQERPTAFFLCTLGFTFSHILGAPLIVVLSTIRATFGGWPVTFYISAIIGFSWMALWILLSTSQPERHQRISRQEKGYILDAIEGQLLECQLHKSSFPQGFSAVWKSKSNLITIYACFVYFAGLTFWENYGLLYAKLLINFPITDQLLWIVDFVPFLAYAAALTVVFYLKRKYDIIKLGSPGTSGIRCLRWMSATGLLGITVLLLPLPFFNCGTSWSILTLGVACTCTAAFAQGQYAFWFQYVHIDNVCILLISCITIGDIGSALAALSIGVLTHFLMFKAWIIVCVVVSVLAFLAAFMILFVKSAAMPVRRKDENEADNEEACLPA